MNSSGLVKLQELKHTVDSMPVNFNFEKRILRNEVTSRHIAQVNEINPYYNEIRDGLLPQFREMII